MRKRLAAAVLGLLVAWAASPALARGPRLAPYVVQPGDSCWSIALKVFGKGERYDVIHRYNDLGPMPHVLEPGQRILLPSDLAEPDARVQAPRNEVRVKAPQLPEWRRALPDMDLWRLFRVATGEDSSAGIAFQDDSMLRMRENALLVIHGGASAMARVERLPRTTVELEKGAIRGGLARLDQESGLTVRTPASTVDLFSPAAQVEVTEDQASCVSVFEGRASVAAQGTRVEVPGDQGTVVQKGARPEKPRPLPRPVTWEGGPAERVVLVPKGEAGEFRARWNEVAGAARYRVELSRDKAFRSVVVDAVVGAGIREFLARDLEPGRYVARVSAIDARRLEGRPSTPLVVEVAAWEASRPLVPSAKDVAEVVGLVRIAVPSALAARVQVRVNGGPWSSGTTPIRLSTAGEYRVGFREGEGEEGGTLAVRVLGVRGRLEVPPRPLPRGAGAVEVRLRVEDERGRPAAVPGISLQADPGGNLAVREVGAGLYQATLPVPESLGDEGLGLRAAWAFGDLDRVVLSREAPPAAVPPAFRWPDAPAALEWARPGLGGPSRAARPVSRLGTSFFVAGAPAAGTAGSPGYRFALLGDLALLDGRLGLDLDLPWRVSVGTDDDANRSRLGDIRLGVRGVALDRAGVVLSPSLRLTFPSSGGFEGRIGWGFEPGVLLEWRAVGPLVLGTNQAVLVDTDFDGSTRVLYRASYTPGVRLWERLELLAELDTGFGLSGDGRAGRARLVVLGGAARVLLGRARLGLAAGGALTRDARDLLGRFTVGLSLDVGFRGP